jgi:predicted nucleotidyltransferase
MTTPCAKCRIISRIISYTHIMRKDDRIRGLIACEAARLMYEEGVREYRDAKRKAAKRFGPEKALSLGSHLPTNAEIHEELARLIETREEKVLPQRLLRMRLAALSYLEFFQEFSPYLVGSVLSGAVTERSDIDIHLFSDSVEKVEELLRERGIPFQTETVPIRKGGVIKDYTHIYLESDGVEIECSVYPAGERRNRTISSITGRAMERAGATQLKKIIAGSIGATENEG